MKHRGKRLALVLAGILIGCILSGPVAHAAAEAISACRSNHKVCVDGKQVELEAYVIEGNNYVRLRDVGMAVGFNVWWDEESRTVMIAGDRPYTGLAPAENAAAIIAESNVADTDEVNPAVFTGALSLVSPK